MDNYNENFSGENIAVNKENNDIEFNVKKNTWHWGQVTVICIIKILISIIAMILAWNCSAKENIVLRLIITIVSGMFAEFYILYYAIYRTYLGNKCYI